MDTFSQDLRYGFRLLRKSPGFAAAAVITLALGIGANTAIFSLMDAVLLRSLPMREARQLVVWQWHANESPKFDEMSSFGDCAANPHGAPRISDCSFSYPFFERARQLRDAFSGVVAFAGAGQLDLSGAGPADIVRGQLVSGDLFQVLGVDTALGRPIQPADDDARANPVAVISYGYWQRAFGASPSVIGRTIRLNAIPFTIIGVASAQFSGITPGHTFDLWIPLSLYQRLGVRWGGKRDDPANAWLILISRLKPGVSAAQAQAAASLLFRNEMLYGSKPLLAPAADPSLTLLPAEQALAGGREDLTAPLTVLMLAVGLVLVIACANLAGLMLARSVARQGEIAVRLALGARRVRVARQLLTESVLLSAMGGVLGVLVADWSAHAIVNVISRGSSRPFPFAVSLDARVLAFTAAVALFSGLFFGMVPAWRGTRVDLASSMKDTGRSSTPHGLSRWLGAGSLLVIAQVALAVVVLSGAGLFVRTLRNLRHVDPGFDTNRLLLFGVDPRLSGYKPEQVQNLYRDIQSRLAAIPGVSSVSYSSAALLTNGLWTTGVSVEGRTDKATVDMLATGPDFFDTLRIRKIAGRIFAPDDFVFGAATVPVIVNQSFVRRYLQSQNPLGKWLNRGGDDSAAGASREQLARGWMIVGVVADAKYPSLKREVKPTVYVPLTNGGAHFELRTRIAPLSLVPAVRSALNAIAPDLPLFNVTTQNEQVDALLVRERLLAQLSGFFAALALLLSCVGLYGLLAYDMTRRTREIGIRMALGAQPWNVLRLVVGQGVILGAIGAAIGTAVALGVTRYLRSLLFDVRPGDPATLAAVAALLALVVLAACYGPARRALAVDVVESLRYE